MPGGDSKTLEKATSVAHGSLKRKRDKQTVSNVRGWLGRGNERGGNKEREEM